MKPKVCLNCLHFEEGYNDVSDGDCHRYPEWTIQLPAHYCGEFKYNLIIQKEMKDSGKLLEYDFSDCNLQG